MVIRLECSMRELIEHGKPWETKALAKHYLSNLKVETSTFSKIDILANLFF